MADVEKDDIKKASFWVSHTLIIIATIVGVFLAANQGYKLAVKFENMVSYKNNYYLQTSLGYELKDNIVILKEYIEKLKDPSWGSAVRQEPLNFYSLVWSNMKFSPTTLETKSEFLRDAQRFYREVEKYKDLLAKGTIAPSFAIQKFEEQISNVEKMLPQLENSAKEIAKEFEGSGVVL